MDSTYRNVALTIIAAIIISLIISIALEISMVPPYLHATNRAVNIFDFYEHIGSNNNKNNTYFIGSSQIEGDVDARLIKDSYNLGLSGDTPLRRIIELLAIIQSKPHALIIGLTYFGLNDTDPDRLDTKDFMGTDLLYENKTKLDFKKWFTEEELKRIDVSPLDYGRAQIYPALLASITGDYNGTNNNMEFFRNVTNFSVPINFKYNSSPLKLLDSLENNTQLTHYMISEKDYRQKQALEYTICELQKAGIYPTFRTLTS